MENFKNPKISLEGEMRIRALKNFARLHDRPYCPGFAGVGPYQSMGWPGDWEGRAMLAHVLHEQTLETKSAFCDELFTWTFSIMNEKGYRGELLDLTDINEQAHSAHNWLLRALLESYLTTGDVRLMEAVKKIICGLYLPLCGHFQNYPKTKEERGFQEGGGRRLLGRPLQRMAAFFGRGLYFHVLGRTDAGSCSDG